MKYFVFLLLFFTLSVSGEEKLSMAAVNPVTPLEQLQFEDDLALKNTHLNIPQNIFYFKPIFQIEKGHFSPLPQLFRIKLFAVGPASLTPYRKEISFGDTQLLDLFIINDDHTLRIGLGAIAILPTATVLAAGQGKWQLGPAFGLNWKINDAWQISFLLQNPYSLGGNSKTSYVKSVLFQPFISYHFGDNQYLISNAEWTLQYNHKKIEIPINIGIGKIFPYQGVKLDACIQSEWMAYKSATASTPCWTLKFCLNILR